MRVLESEDRHKQSESESADNAGNLWFEGSGGPVWIAE
jgi:hypothetical protein